MSRGDSVDKYFTAEADFNLSPSRFVSVAEEEEYREIKEIKRDLSQIEKEKEAVESKINKILGIKK